MMKKVTFIAIALMAIAPLASASVISPMKIAVLGGGVYGIDLINGMSSAVDGSGGYFAIVGVEAPLTDGVITALAPDASGLYGDVAGAGVGLVHGVYGFFGSYNGTWSSPEGLYADGFNSTAATIELYSISDDFSTVTLVDSVPEPVTVALLGLGGMFVARRKKA